MNRTLSILLVTSGLVSCASQERTEPPAPIVTAGTPAPAPATTTKPTTTTPAQETVEVYAYRPPPSAPDAPTAPSALTAEAPSPPPTGAVSAATSQPTVDTQERAPAPSTSAPGTPPKDPTATPDPAAQVVAHVPPATSCLVPAADSLVQQADQQRQAGDYAGAAATLERALGIQPQDPYIWNRLARVRVEQGLFAQAGNLASRSNALAGDRVALKQDNWRIIAAARRAVGDAAGAAEAEAKARGG